MNTLAKSIETAQLPLSKIRTDFGNPKKIEKKELERLKKSLVENGDFGMLVLNESLQCLSGNQRVVAMRALQAEGNSTLDFDHIDVKILHGFSIEEQKRVLLEANATRGQYILRDLEEFLEGTDLDMGDFNISSTMFSKEKNRESKKDTYEELDTGDPDLPLIVAVDVPEWEAFQKLKESMNIADDHKAVAKMIQIVCSRQKK